MQTSDKKISGVLYPTPSAEKFQLRRYLPTPELAPLVEQFWLVDWDLRGQPAHTQQNLPDPNMHLVVSDKGAKILGPVSKKYRYTMQGQGKIIGVKFNLGVLAKRLPCLIDQAVDKEFAVTQIFELNPQALIENTLDTRNDKITVTYLSQALQKYAHKLDPATHAVQTLATQIKTNHAINSVEILSQLSHTSVRSLQRLFKTYVGLSPKWLIRKYRLHHALERLENQRLTLAELAVNLDYSDQSHLIRDFNEFLNITPKQYALAKTLLS
ncbi:helix-turn-helix transcriptional regulator [uncultured Paraglaciecola sp.]|uniref:helix-turn-helix transcriptional regulator n=1 Tax=uncultured Paraglaciecola sp. TaxID=1765024 RepID=UPI0030D952CF|tara:strand:- start:122254 stop:123060 length:807 start_codon:yes stop_codon:yes gene_type:complete